MSDAEVKPGAPPLAYTVSEAAGVMRVSRNTIYRMASKGDLRTVRVGRLMFVTAESIAAYYDLGVERVVAAAGAG